MAVCENAARSPAGENAVELIGSYAGGGGTASPILGIGQLLGSVPLAHLAGTGVDGLGR